MRKKMSQKGYALNYGQMCPFCLCGGTLVSDSFDLGETLHKLCTHCGKYFLQRHKIIGYKEVEQPII